EPIETAVRQLRDAQTAVALALSGLPRGRQRRGLDPVSRAERLRRLEWQGLSHQFQQDAQFDLAHTCPVRQILADLDAQSYFSYSLRKGQAIHAMPGPQNRQAPLGAVRRSAAH